MTPTSLPRRCAATLAAAIAALIDRTQFLGTGPWTCALWFALTAVLSCAATAAQVAPVPLQTQLSGGAVEAAAAVSTGA